MINMLLHHTLDVKAVSEGNIPFWQLFCNDVMNLLDRNVGCIIDAGAIFAGKPLEEEVVPWICRHPLFRKIGKFKGITFCDKRGNWKVYDTATESVV